MFLLQTCNEIPVTKEKDSAQSVLVIDKISSKVGSITSQNFESENDNLTI